MFHLNLQGCMSLSHSQTQTTMLRAHDRFAVPLPWAFSSKKMCPNSSLQPPKLAPPPPQKKPENPQKKKPPLLLWRLGLVFSRVQARSIASRRTASKPAVRRVGVHGGSSSSPWRVGVVELGGDGDSRKRWRRPMDGVRFGECPGSSELTLFWGPVFCDLFQGVKHFSHLGDQEVTWKKLVEIFCHTYMIS